MKDNKITMEDIEKTMQTVRENMPNKTHETYWGWLGVNYLGEIVSIKLKRNQIKEIKKIFNDGFRINGYNKPLPKNTKLKTIYGLKVLNQIRLDKK